MGVTNTVYKEINNPLATQGPNGALTIVCAVCHDPHGSPNLGPDAFPGGHRGCGHESVRALSQPAVRRPNARAATRVRTRRKVRSSSANNNVGWRPPNMTQDNIHGSHGDTLVNSKLCATCHIFKSRAQIRSGITFFSTGHLFLAIPCVECEREAAADRLRGGEPHVQRVRDAGATRRARSRRA